MSFKALFVGLLLVAVLGACGGEPLVTDRPSGGPGSEKPTSQDSLEKTPHRRHHQVPNRPPGCGCPIYSHSGVRSAWVKGELWLADPPLGGHNPPPGWDENETTGEFVVTSTGRAMFIGDSGQETRFRLAEPGAKDPNAGCE